MSEEKEKIVGVSYIGSKQIYRMIIGPKDYRPYCFHYHETIAEATTCKYALEMLEFGTPAPFPVEEKRKK